VNIKNVWIIALLAVIGAVALWGCNKTAEEPTDTAPTSDSTSTTTPEQTAPDPRMGDSKAEPVAYTNEKGEIICPVMGTVIESKEKAVGYQDYEGMRYYFCCDGCPEQFKKDPAKYAKKGATGGTVKTETGHAGTGDSGA